jgi:hypothetical protein
MSGLLRARIRPVRVAWLVLAALPLLLAACAANEEPTVPEAAPRPRVQAPRSVERTYVVRPGDYLAAIAREQGVPLEELVALNEIPDPTRIEVGQEIVLSVDTVRRQRAQPIELPSEATDLSPLLEAAPEWPVEMTLGESAIAFVAVFGAAAAILLYAVHNAFSLALEASGGLRAPVPRFGRLPLGWLRAMRPSLAIPWRRRPAVNDDDEAPRRAAGRARRAWARLHHAARRTWSMAARWGRPGLERARPAAALGWLWLRLAVARGAALTLRGTRILVRRLRPLGSRAKEALSGVAVGRRRGKLRRELEEQAELPLRLGLVDEAEARFRADLEECQREGWELEAALCMQGLGNVAQARGDTEQAVALLDQAIAAFGRAGEAQYVLGARMQREAVRPQE